MILIEPLVLFILPDSFELPLLIEIRDNQQHQNRSTFKSDRSQLLNFHLSVAKSSRLMNLPNLFT